MWSSCLALQISSKVFLSFCVTLFSFLLRPLQYQKYSRRATKNWRNYFYHCFNWKLCCVSKLFVVVSWYHLFFFNKNYYLEVATATSTFEFEEVWSTAPEVGGTGEDLLTAAALLLPDDTAWPLAECLCWPADGPPDLLLLEFEGAACFDVLLYVDEAAEVVEALPGPSLAGFRSAPAIAAGPACGVEDAKGAALDITLGFTCSLSLALTPEKSNWAIKKDVSKWTWK